MRSLARCFRGLAGLSLLVAATSCASGASGQAVTPSRQSLTLHGHPLELRVSPGTAHRAGPLLLYATGDGGWSGGEMLFDGMRTWGYPVAGFSSADYVSLLDGPGGVIEPGGLAADYGAVVDASLRALDLTAGTHVVLVGFSRGSGLSVAAALDAHLRSRLRGILAVALTGEEEYVAERASGADSATGVMLQLYPALPRLGSLHVAVIQSTRDEFLPAAEAQRRFGPETSSRRFRALDAADHSFSDKIAALGDEMKAAFDWILRAG